MAPDLATAPAPVAAAPVATSPSPADLDGPGRGEALVEEELLVEEISIDGMCGVY